MAPAAGNRVARAVVLLVAVLLVARGASAASSCSPVYSTLKPCLGYVLSGGSVPPACCSGIKTLAARSAADRRAACACIKQLSAGGSARSRATGLPGRCGVNVNCNA